MLRLWAEGAEARGVDRVDRIIGNHEILMLLAMGNGPRAEKAAAMWLAERTGGNKVLAEMQRTKTHFVVVVDEYGGMAGVATMEDIIEELVGEVQAAFDA